VIGGSFARMFLKSAAPELKIVGYATRIGPFELTDDEKSKVLQMKIDDFTGRFPSSRHAEVREALAKIQSQGESWGGTAEIRATGMPQGLGQPVFQKLKSDLAMAMMSVGAACAFEVGEGLRAAEKAGTSFHQGEKPYGGIRGGISTGEDLVLRVHFKPTSSILDVAKQGRHDPCIVPRAIPVLEAMTALVLADHVLWRRLDRI
jgi:chorismate synthase